MADRRERSEKLFKAAVEAASGAEVEGLFRASRPSMLPFRETPWRKRPWVLRSPGVKSAPVRKIVVVALRGLMLDWPDRKISFTAGGSAARERAEKVQDAGKSRTNSAVEQLNYYFGPEGSVAAGLLVATLPRSKARVLSLLCVTRDELMLLHVPDTYRLKHFANAVDVGWRVDREQLEWARNTSDDQEKLSKVQYGFTDGSWMTLCTASVEELPDLPEVFPGILTKEDPIPANSNYPEPESGT